MTLRAQIEEAYTKSGNTMGWRLSLRPIRLIAYPSDCKIVIPRPKRVKLSIFEGIIDCSYVYWPFF
jgi:hypothetical protein